MKLYRTLDGPVLEVNGTHAALPAFQWDNLIEREDLPEVLARAAADRATWKSGSPAPSRLLAPIGSRQEIWAAGVTYFRSRTARMEESKDAGGSSFYDRVYEADRPELFFKATPHRTVGPGESMHLRGDSKWIVPEPELTLLISPGGKIMGYTVGNDLSCRDIEGENPLYLPQAKVFSRCAAVGPAMWISREPLPGSTKIALEIRRGGKTIVTDGTSLDQMKKKLSDLARYLYLDNDFPHGCLMMTGTGIVPANDFCLQSGDEVAITIDPIGTLTNPMA